MTDLVERLRAPDNALLLLEAADEIDRLRVALRESSLREGLLEAEIEKLRAQVVALQSSLEVGAKEKKA